MSFIKTIENDIKNIIYKLGYDIDTVTLAISNRPDLGEYQINDAMKIAKIYKKNPREIAMSIVEELNNDKRFTNINIAGAGFINISISNDYLIECMNKTIENVYNNIDLQEKKKIIIDYGGANVAKILHVGHLRSANIGEALKRLARFLGHDIIGDVHLGDSGLQAGIVCLEMKDRFPNLICFKEDYHGEDFELPITSHDLSYIYPEGSTRIKADEELLNEARNITYLIQKGHIGYCKLWDKISSLSIKTIKEIYEELNATFELWEGERITFDIIPEMLDILEKKGLLYTSDGAKVMDVKEETDDKEMPPIILEKSDGAYLYGTTDLATIYSRMKRFNPDEIWYVVDNRQELHFNQVFRAAYKSEIVKKDTSLQFLGFGTMNGKDGKPFKTRDGGVMSLPDLINIVNEETLNKLNPAITDELDKKKISRTIAIAAIKYADLIPYRSTDYIFDPNKFSDLDGKTGPYLLYSTIRMRSLLNKAKEQNINFNIIKTLKNEYDKDIMLNILNLSSIITKAYESKSLNELTDYIYKLTSSYNKFYSENRILDEQDIILRESWLALTKLVLDTNLLLLNILGINCPEKM